MSLKGFLRDLKKADLQNLCDEAGLDSSLNAPELREQLLLHCNVYPDHLPSGFAEYRQAKDAGKNPNRPITPDPNVDRDFFQNSDDDDAGNVTGPVQVNVINPTPPPSVGGTPTATTPLTTPPTSPTPVHRTPPTSLAVSMPTSATSLPTSPSRTYVNVVRIPPGGISNVPAVTSTSVTSISQLSTVQGTPVSVPQSTSSSSTTSQSIINPISSVSSGRSIPTSSSGLPSCPPNYVPISSSSISQASHPAQNFFSNVPPPTISGVVPPPHFYYPPTQMYAPPQPPMMYPYNLPPLPNFNQPGNASNSSVDIANLTQALVNALQAVNKTAVPASTSFSKSLKPKPEDKSNAIAVKTFLKEARERKLRFGGNIKEDVREFFKKLEKLRKYFPLADDVMVTVFPDLLIGAAARFVDTHPELCVDWEETKALFLDVFSPFVSPNQLKADMHERTQVTHERIDYYVSLMKTMNERLPKPMSDDAFLEMIIENLTPEYTDMIRDKEVDSLEELAEICRNGEKIVERKKRYKPPPARLLKPLLNKYDEFSTSKRDESPRRDSYRREDSPRRSEYSRRDSSPYRQSENSRRDSSPYRQSENSKRDSSPYRKSDNKNSYASATKLEAETETPKNEKCVKFKPRPLSPSPKPKTKSSEN